MTIAVTGATGHLGRLVVEALLGRGVPAADIVAVVRTPAKAADLADRGVGIRRRTTAIAPRSRPPSPASTSCCSSPAARSVSGWPSTPT